MVQDASGTPLGGYNVDLGNSGGDVFTTTASDGSFSLNVAPGQYTLSVGGTPGTYSVNYSASINLSASLTGQTVTLPSAVPVTIAVADDAGSPVQGAAVTALVNRCTISGVTLLPGVTGQGSAQEVGFQLNSASTDANGKPPSPTPPATTATPTGSPECTPQQAATWKTRQQPSPNTPPSPPPSPSP